MTNKAIETFEQLKAEVKSLLGDDVEVVCYENTHPSKVFHGTTMSPARTERLVMAYKSSFKIRPAVKAAFCRPDGANFSDLYRLLDERRDVQFIFAVDDDTSAGYDDPKPTYRSFYNIIVKGKESKIWWV